MKKRTVIAGILALAGIICAGVAGYQYYQDRHAGKEYEDLKEKVVKEKQEEEPEEEEKTPLDIPIDFEQLQSMNPEIYAWIRIPGSVIVYWSSFLVTLCSEIMLYIETPLVSYSYSLNEVSHSCTS